MTSKRPGTQTTDTGRDKGPLRGATKGASALWLGAGDGRLEMGSGRGPKTMESHEFVSWFFSRDGI